MTPDQIIDAFIVRRAIRNIIGEYWVARAAQAMLPEMSYYERSVVIKMALCYN